MKINISFSRLLLLLTLGFVLTSCGQEQAPGISESAGTVASEEQLDALLADIEALEQSLTRVKDVNEIKRLQRIYGYYLDRSDWDNVLGLLTEDATAEYGNAGVYVGKDSVRGLLYAIGYGEKGLQPEQLRDHIVLQPVITVSDSGDTAQGRWRLLGLLGQYEEYARWQAGPYENEYRKEDGVWKISKLHWLETFTVPFEGGWSAKMEQTNVADRAIPASDLPPSIDYEPWPSVSLLPYHYTNPVSDQEQGELK